MKKSLLALAALGLFAGAASAQSSVTVFGVVDLSLRWAEHGDTSMYSLANDGYNSSRLGFRGVEDLGGGLKANFWLEAGMDAGDGTVGGGTYTGVTGFFNRRATVGLSGGWGEFRLGRDYNPSFWNMTIFDPFGTNGVGSSLNLSPVDRTGIIAQTLVRSNNSVGYLLPGGLGGLYGQAMVAANEGRNGQKYYGGRIGWAAGPFDIAYAIGETQADIFHDDYARLQNVGGSWNFGFAKLMGQWVEISFKGQKQTNYMIGGTMPLGQGTLQASWVTADRSGSDDDADQWAVGYVYNLSKRTALYASYASLSNDGAGRFTVSTKPAAPAKGGFDSQGYEFGLRHAF